jgi:hypothetical protein
MNERCANGWLHAMSDIYRERDAVAYQLAIRLLKKQLYSTGFPEFSSPFSSNNKNKIQAVRRMRLAVECTTYVHACWSVRF